MSWLASDRHGVRLLILINHVLAASGQLKEGHFCLRGTAEVRANFSFGQGRSFFCAFVVPTNCQGILGISAITELILFYIFSFTFFYPHRNLANKISGAAAVHIREGHKNVSPSS